MKLLSKNHCQAPEPVHQAVQKEVTIAPEFTKKLKDMETTEGESVTLEVAATGTPKPEVKW